ncbi:MAG: hypothetical protein GX891_03745 [Clostridiales bacterium]|nr:hypothetical protein [Clostridiales bacterium]
MAYTYSVYKRKRADKDKALNITLASVLGFFAFVFLAFAVICLIYIIPVTVATKSAMPFFFVLGLLLLSSFAGLLLLIPFFNTLVKINPLLSNKLPANGNKTKKIYAFVMNIIGIVGGSVVILSAFLGALSEKKWTAALTDFKAENGYFATAQKRQLAFDAGKVKTINLNIDSKNVAVIYYDNDDLIRFDYLSLYQDDVIMAHRDETLIITDTFSPKKYAPLENMLFFIFRPSVNEKQIKLYIPIEYKNEIEINGDYILAKN